LLQGADLALQGGRGLFVVVLEDQLAPLEKLLLPAIELARLDAVLVAQIGDRLFVHQVSFEDGDFLFRRQVAPPLVILFGFSHVFRYELVTNSGCGKVHFRLKQDTWTGWRSRLLRDSDYLA